MARKINRDERRWIDSFLRILSNQPETLEILIKDDGMLEIIDSMGGSSLKTIETFWEKESHKPKITHVAL